MRNAFRIFRRDMKRLLRNPAAILVLIGVSILPSLYAWFNIAANIDPYANTSGIKVAVANLDTDATHDDLTINAGSQIINQLKENDQLGWTFVSKDAAIEGVKSGEYYAAIIIPQDFSESLLSVLSGKIETPELEYYINEKLNAIAPKITSSGASTIQTQINNTFSSVASETIAELLKESVFNISDLLIPQLRISTACLPKLRTIFRNMLSSWISFKLVQLIQMRLFRMRKMQLIHSELLPLPVQMHCLMQTRSCRQQDPPQENFLLHSLRHFPTENCCLGKLTALHLPE